MAYYSPRREQQLRDLAARKQELQELEQRLAEREEALDELIAENKIFEYEYWQRVGRFYLELEKVEGQIAELQAKLNNHPETLPDPPLEWHWKPAAETPSPAEVKTATELKKLYREAAKLLHPDYATDDADRLRRTELMAQANQAYAANDGNTLQSLLRQARGAQAAISEADLEIENQNVSRRIAQILNRLSEIDDEIYRLQLGELAQLQIQVAEAKLIRRDLLGELSAQAYARLQKAQHQLAQLQQLAR